MIHFLNAKANMNQVVKDLNGIRTARIYSGILASKGLPSRSSFTRIYLLPTNFASWQSGGGTTTPLNAPLRAVYLSGISLGSFTLLGKMRSAVPHRGLVVI